MAGSHDQSEPDDDGLALDHDRIDLLKRIADALDVPVASFFVDRVEHRFCGDGDEGSKPDLDQLTSAFAAIPTEQLRRRLIDIAWLFAARRDVTN